jgi:hypothetical protein
MTTLTFATRPADLTDVFASIALTLVSHTCEVDEETAAVYAKAGATLLDEHRPDWWRGVDLDALDIKDTQFCMLGQVYGDFARGAKALFGDWTQNGVSPVMTHGFDACSYTGARNLEGAWRDEVMSRAAAAALA